MLRKSLASRRDKGDFTPSSMLKRVIDMFESANSKSDIPALQAFFLDMEAELGVDHEIVKARARAYLDNTEKERSEMAVLESLESLRNAVSGYHEKIFERILAQPNGMKTLIDMRSSLLNVISKLTVASRTGGEEEKRQLARLKSLEVSLRDQLQHWFSIGFLDLERITWESPAALLEKIKAYSESVHPMKDWQSLKLRLTSGRRCFGFFHPSMPLEPLVFIEVALTNEISSKIAPILQGYSAVPEKEATTAIFYAITSTQPGLSGVDLGHMLIEKVVQALQAELPNLHTFSTFSPIPTFKSWLDATLTRASNPESTPQTPFNFVNERNLSALTKAYRSIATDLSAEPLSGPLLLTRLLAHPDWHLNPLIVESLEEPLQRMAAHYIALERKRRLAVDPVANFHLRNGAEFHRLCWLADTSPKRILQSCGMMVNYMYRLDQLSVNNEAYLAKGQIPTSDAIQAWL
jgi:hypothetical protein